MKNIFLIVFPLAILVLTEVFMLSYINRLKSYGFQDAGVAKAPPKVDTAISDPYVNKVKAAFQRAQQNEGMTMTLLFEQKGYVQKNVDEEKNTTYITLVDKMGKKIFTLGSSYYNNMYRIIDGKKVPISVNSVKTGDTIIDREYFNVYNSSNSAEIIVYAK